MTNFEKANGSRAGGTHYQGYVNTSFRNLVETFGYPNRGGSLDGKVKAEWILDFDGDIATIYDYKEYDKIPEQVTDWHIGGFDRRVVGYVAEALDMEVS